MLNLSPLVETKSFPSMKNADRYASLRKTRFHEEWFSTDPCALSFFEKIP